jgi:hypothetical protein
MARKRFVLAVYKDEPNTSDWLEGYDVFVVELSSELARRYVRVMDRVKAWKHELQQEDLGDLYEVRLWDYRGDWLPGDDEAEAIVTDDGEEVQPPLAGAEEGSRTECDISHVGPDEMHWTAVACDVRLSTSKITRAALEALAAELEPA